MVHLAASGALSLGVLVYFAVLGTETSVGGRDHGCFARDHGCFARDHGCFARDHGCFARDHGFPGDAEWGEGEFRKCQFDAGGRCARLHYASL
jgi:hypothetical protein